jgi:hypothetical protein
MAPSWTSGAYSKASSQDLGAVDVGTVENYQVERDVIVSSMTGHASSSDMERRMGLFGQAKSPNGFDSAEITIVVGDPNTMAKHLCGVSSVVLSETSRGTAETGEQ